MNSVGPEDMRISTRGAVPYLYMSYYTDFNLVATDFIVSFKEFML